MAIFTQQEMQRRWTNLRRKMNERGMNAVIATSYPGSYYLSGTPIHPFGRPMATLIPLEGEPAIIESIIEIGHTRAQSPINDVRTYWDYNPEPVTENPRPPLLSMLHHLRAAVADRGLAAGRIGIEDGTLPLAHYHALRELLPNASFVGVSDVLDGLRAVLSGEELRLVQIGDAVSDLGQEKFIELARPGSSAYELHSQIEKAMVEELLHKYPELPFRVHVGMGMGNRAKGAGHSEWTTWGLDNRLPAAGMVESVFSAWVYGYWGNVERAVSIGEPSPEYRRSFDIMIEANETAIAAIRPGLRLADVDRICKAIFAMYGYTTRSGSGCGRGITSYEANARELKMDIRVYSDVILEAGMAFSLEPDLEVPGQGTFRHCNTIIVTENGCEVDSRLPRGIICIEG